MEKQWSESHSHTYTKSKYSMVKISIASFLAIGIATSFSFVLSSSPPKSYYHSLYKSNSISDNASISHDLYMLTRRPHVAGTEANAQAAAYVLSTLASYSINSHIVSYDVSLTYPISRSLVLTQPEPASEQLPVVFDLRQEIYDGDPYADAAREVLPSFHAYAKSGTVRGAVVYANYGRVEDFKRLKEMGVNVTESIVLARYGKIYRGDIVNNAFEAGAIGAIVYTDKKDYGGGGDGGWFPEAKWMPPSGVQVGSVYDGAGDPSTPGWPSIQGCERLSDDEVEKQGNVPLIPSLPVSAADGETIMRSVGGQVADADWQGSKEGPTYRLGPGPGILNLTYTGKKAIETIQNVIGIIEGAEEPDRFVVLGNHRDAWTFGAVDPNSGTAALLEVARRLMKLEKRGWKPRRTIVLCNWDAEEYGLIGSTEWVEDNRQLLASRAVAYLNVDCAVSGAGFHASATPQLDKLLMKTTRQVDDPENSSQTLYESWAAAPNNSPTIERLGGGGSDYAAFVQHIGIASADISFGRGYPVYHSMYDDFVWMEKFGDPMFRRHIAVASVWGLLTLQLADEEFLPFDYLSYAYELQKNAKELEDEISDRGTRLAPLFESIKKLKDAATKINQERKAMEEKRVWPWMLKRDKVKVREINDRLMMAERAFTDAEGLSGRPWYKHLIYAPSKHDDYGSNYFPGIDDAIERAKSLSTPESWHLVQHQVWRVSRAVRHVSQVLNGELT